MIKYVKGDVTKPEKTDGICVIVHVCNDEGGWGPKDRSVADAIGKRWPEAKDEYKQQFADGAPGLKLGEVQLVAIDGENTAGNPPLWIANCIAQHNYRKPGNLQPFKYEAFEACCDFLVRTFAGQNASFHMPKVGTKLGGADWHSVEHIIERTLEAAGLAVTVYVL